MNQRAYRLPPSTIPVSYMIRLDIDMDQKHFPGFVQILLDVAKRTHVVELHAHELHVHHAAFLYPDGRKVDAKVLPVPQKQMIRFFVPEAESFEGRMQLEIEYVGRLNPGMHGLYLAQDHHEKALCSQCQATSAREIFPCFDEPAFKAPLQFTIRTPNRDDMIVLTNGRQVRCETVDGKKVWHFAKTRSISSYLAAVVLGDFESEPASYVHDIPISVYALRGKKKQTEFALRCTEKLLPFFEEYFGVPYPYEKYDQVAVPGFDASAMENIGLVLFRQSVLLMDPKTTSWRQQKRMALVIAHEFAHMWFGNWVTMKWWDDLWLNEAFAEWMSHKAMNALEPSYRVWDDFQEARNHAMKDDGLPTTHAIWTPVETPEEAVEMFDSITYEKGCAVMRMLEHFLGESSFGKGLQRYMKAFAESNAEGADLWDKLTETSGHDVNTLMASWVKQPGFPIITVESHPERLGELRLSQRRFFENEADREIHDDSLWTVPMVIRYRDDRGVSEYRHLFSQREETIRLPAVGSVSFVYPNAKQIGFYRLNVDPRLTETIISQGPQLLEPCEQVGFIDDAWFLVQRGEFSLRDFLRLLESCAQSRDATVVRAIADRLSLFDLVITDMADDSLHQKFRQWISKLLLPAWASFASSSVREDEDPSSAELRGALWSILSHLAHQPTAIAMAEEFAGRERAHASSVNPNVAGTVVGIAARFGDSQRFQEYLDVYLSRKEQGASPHEIQRYLQAFALFQSQALVTRTLDLIDKRLVPQESIRTVLIQLMGYRHSQPMAWEYVQTNWVQLKDSIGDFGLSRLMESVGSLHPQFREELLSFFQKNPPLRAERALARGLKKLDQYERLYRILSSQVHSLFTERLEF